MFWKGFFVGPSVLSPPSQSWLVTYPQDHPSYEPCTSLNPVNLESEQKQRNSPKEYTIVRQKKEIIAKTKYVIQQ